MKSVKEMTLKEKIGQVVICGFQGTKFSDELQQLIKEYKLGNVILFTRNIENVKQMHDLNMQIHKSIIDEVGIMPFISIDQEGGMVTRIMKEATFFPGNMTLGATGNYEYAYNVGKIMGEELRSIGVNMNLAPSLDVNNNPLNPVIGVRSYSDDPEVVAKFGRNYILGLQSTGVIATAKHFPGHGDTNVDSHRGLPVILHDKERLENLELVPFKRCLNDCNAIMSAHILFKAYEDSDLPGTLSKKVITDLLRKKFEYKGLIISDCMEMKAIDEKYGAPRGALMGLKAGLDQVMISATFSKQVEAFKIIEEAVLSNELPIEELDEKVERILKAKENNYKTIEENFFNKTWKEKKEILLKKESKDFVSKIVDLSLTKVRGKDLYLNKKTLIIATEPFAMTIAEDELSDRSIVSAIKESGLDVDTIKINMDLSEEEIENILLKAKYYEQVLVCTYNATLYKKQALLINKLNNVCEELFVLSTRSPYDIYQFRACKNYLCLYEYTPNSVMTLVRYLKKEIKCCGKLPISLNEKIEVGASVYVGLDEYPLEKNLKYLEMLKEEHIEKVFISGHIPEVKEGFVEELKEVCKKAKELGLKMILDISKPMYEKLSSCLPDVYALRLDYGFSLEEMVKMCKENKFIIELNASTITEEKVNYLLNQGIVLQNIRVSHNFYPKKYTGLSRESVLKKNEFLNSLGMKVAIYIPSSNQHRPPMYEGLPTIEEHRNQILEATLSEIRSLGVSEVIFGDAYCSLNELTLARDFNYDISVIPLKLFDDCSDEIKKTLEKVFVNRTDATPFFVRGSNRCENIKPFNTIKRNKKYVTIDNEGFKRYQGEVCIMLEDLESDERVNVVGECMCSLETLKMIKPGGKFIFKIVR